MTDEEKMKQALKIFEEMNASGANPSVSNQQTQSQNAQPMDKGNIGASDVASIAASSGGSPYTLAAMGVAKQLQANQARQNAYRNAVYQSAIERNKDSQQAVSNLLQATKSMRYV